jgi:endo-1,4-beta-xylanase
MLRTAIALALSFAAALSQTASTSYAQAGGARPKAGMRTPPKAEWLDSNHEAINGTKYETFKSKTLGEDVSYLVYLPPEYAKDSKRYPVIYWLHGLYGNQRGGAMVFVPRVEKAIGEGLLPGVIVVSVNGMVNSFYNDWDDGKLPMESVIIKDLIPHVDATYRTVASREGRIIEGFSMGGYGAAHLGFKYPELFGTVVIDAGALITDLALKGPMIGPIFQGAWGGDMERFKAEHPYQLVEKNAEKIRGKTNIRVGVGEDDNLIARNREMHEILDKLDIAHEYYTVPGVGHVAPAYFNGLGDKQFAIHRKALEALAK